MKRKTIWLIGIPIVIAALWLVSTSRAATETPEYKVIRTAANLEIRDYPALAIAPIGMAGDGMNGGFRQLSRFTTGNNESKEKIAMASQRKRL